MKTHTSETAENENLSQPTEDASRKKQKLTTTVFAIAVVAVLSFFYYRYLPVVEIRSTRDTTQIKKEALISKVQKLIILPTSEEPNIIEINDPVAITKQQPFFTGSEKGDILFIYEKLARAIIYSPSRNIIVNVGPITQEQQNTTFSAREATSTVSKKKQ